MSKEKERNNFVYTKHVEERMKQRGITRDDIKMAVRNPTYEKRYGWSKKSFRELEIIGGNIKKTLVVIWRWDENQLIIQTVYHDFIKFK